MTISKTTMTGPVYLPNCQKPEEARIVFELTGWDKEPGEAVFVSGPYVANLDANGDFTTELFTTNSGTNGVTYRAYALYEQANGIHKREYLGMFSLASPGPFQLSDITMVDELSYTNTFDVLAEISAYADSVRLGFGSNFRDEAEVFAGSALTSRDQALAAVEVSTPNKFFSTKAEADAATLVNGDVLHIFEDESFGMLETRYLVVGGVAVRKTHVDVPSIRYADLATANTSATTLSTGDLVRVSGFATAGDGGGFVGVVQATTSTAHPGGGRLKPVGTINVKSYGAIGDGVADDHAAIEQAANAVESFKTTYSVSGGPAATIGPALYFPYGVYNCGGEKIILPSFVNPVAIGGQVTILEGSFRWAGPTHGRTIENFRIVNPPSKKALITAVTVRTDIPVVRGGSGTTTSYTPALMTQVMFTSVGHGLQDDDFVRIVALGGMHQANGRGGYVGVIDADTFVWDRRNPNYDSSLSSPHKNSVEWDGVGWDVADWGTASIGSGSAAQWREGGAIEYETANTSLRTMRFVNVEVKSDPDDRSAGVVAMGYHDTRSTSMYFGSCVFDGPARAIHSVCDSLTIDSCFMWQRTSSEGLIYSRGATVMTGGVYVPRENAEGAHWVSRDPKREIAGVNHFLSNGVRWSGEAGGIAVVRTLSSTTTLQGSGENGINPSSIGFVGGYIAVPLGSGAVLLGRGDDDGAWVPNNIYFSNVDIAFNSSSATPAYLVQTEIENSAIDATMQDGYNFHIEIDEHSLSVATRLGSMPLPDNLLPYMTQKARRVMTDRYQVVSSNAITNPDILLGSSIELTGGGTERIIDEIQNAKPGDRVTLIARAGQAVVWRVPHDSTSTTTTFILKDGVDFDPVAPASLSLLFLENGDAYEVGRT